MGAPFRTRQGTILFRAPFTRVRARAATSAATNVWRLFFSAVPVTSKSTGYSPSPSSRTHIALSKRSRRTLRWRVLLSGWRASHRRLMFAFATAAASLYEVGLVFDFETDV